MTLAFGLAATTGLASGPAIRLAVLEYGTVRWELTAIEDLALDTAHGIALDVTGYASSSAAKLAFLAGSADAMVSDWLWVARERSAGRDPVFLPYSRAVGGILVPPGSSIQTLSDLTGKTVGVAGGPLDKSWLILRAHSAQQGFDLQAETEQIFAAPPLLAAKARSGDLDALVTYWHYMARLEAAGFRRLIDVADAARALGLDPATPLLGYVFNGSFVERHPELVRNFAQASHEAKSALASDPPWTTLRPLMKARNDAEFAALRAGFRAGFPGAVDRDSAAVMFRLMRELGGPALTGPSELLPEGVFVEP